MCRGSKLQAKFTKLQAESTKKQEQAAAQLAELQQKLDATLAALPSVDSEALQEALDKVCTRVTVTVCSLHNFNFVNPRPQMQLSLSLTCLRARRVGGCSAAKLWGS